MVNLTSQQLTKTEIELIIFLLEHITEKFGIRELSRKIKMDYKLVHTTIQKLVKKEVLVKQKQANLELCSLNLNHNSPYILYCEMLRSKSFLESHKDLKQFFDNLQGNIKNSYYSLAIFGSFARSQEHKNSDLDLLIIAPDKEIAEEINRVVQSEAIVIKRKIHTIAIAEDDFIKNLADKKLNVVVECFKNHLIITGAEAFYNGIRKVFG